MSEAAYQALVLGGGINGLAAVDALHRLGVQRLGLVERFELGHARGSSHGESRVTRSVYPNPVYARLCDTAAREEWPRWEKQLGRKLIYPTPCCFFGPKGQTIDEYAQAGGMIEPLEPDEARWRFPQFRFADGDTVLQDHTGGVIAAAQTIDGLVTWLRSRDVELIEQTTVHTIDPTTDPITLETDAGLLRTERLVVAAGPWTAQLLPELKPRLSVARQTVAYFRLKGEPVDFQAGHFPVWAYMGDGLNNFYYGLPQFGREGIKIARHVTSGIEDDPDLELDAVDPAACQHLREFVETHFTDPIEEAVGSEHCLYTNTSTEDFILDLHPANPRIAVGAGFSGHSFKFAPLTGRILAALVIDGTTAIDAFEANRSLFAYPQP